MENGVIASVRLARLLHRESQGRSKLPSQATAGLSLSPRNQNVGRSGCSDEPDPLVRSALHIVGRPAHQLDAHGREPADCVLALGAGEPDAIQMVRLDDDSISGDGTHGAGLESDKHSDEKPEYGAAERQLQDNPGISNQGPIEHAGEDDGLNGESAFENQAPDAGCVELVRQRDRHFSLPLVHQAFLDGIPRQLGVVFHPQLFEDAHAVGTDGFDAEGQFLSDFTYGLS